MKGRSEIKWDKIQKVIDMASGTDEGMETRGILQHGTPEMKLALLKKAGIEFSDLEAMHKELEKVIYKGSIPWWWW
jgi:hypothetical protein